MLQGPFLPVAQVPWTPRYKVGICFQIGQDLTGKWETCQVLKSFFVTRKSHRAAVSVRLAPGAWAGWSCGLSRSVWA